MHFTSTHQILSLDDDTMVIFESDTNKIVVTAKRTGAEEWTLSAPGAEPRTVKTSEVTCADRIHAVRAHESTRCAAVDELIRFAEETAAPELARVMTVRVPYRHEGDEDSKVKIRLRDEL